MAVKKWRAGVGEAATWGYWAAIGALVLLSFFLLSGTACDEIYVVGEGETLHTIGDKCGDPFIVERNPQINDPDDVYPGLILSIITPLPLPNPNRKLLRY